MNSQFLATWTGQPSDSHAHTHIIIDPPNGRNHPLWPCATDCARNNKGYKIASQPLYIRHTTSTTLQLACNHAFTGSYSECFCQANPLEFHSCWLWASQPQSHHPTLPTTYLPLHQCRALQDAITPSPSLSSSLPRGE